LGGAVCSVGLSESGTVERGTIGAGRYGL
jgi:hypothetical protein